MRSPRLHSLLGIFALLLFVSQAMAQNKTFTDPAFEFTFDIPDARWKVVNKSPNLNLVFGTAKEGDLEVRKLTVDSAKPISDVMKSEEEKLFLRPGFVAGKDENFNGALRGGIYNFEYVNAGRAMSGRFYFLRSGDSVYLLRFTGYTDNLKSLRTQTDQMARTFQIKKS